MSIQKRPLGLRVAARLQDTMEETPRVRAPGSPQGGAVNPPPSSGTFSPAAHESPAPVPPPPKRNQVPRRDVALGALALVGLIVLWFVLFAVLPTYIFANWSIAPRAGLVLVSVAGLITVSIVKQRPGIAVGIGIAFAAVLLIFVAFAFWVIQSLNL